MSDSGQQEPESTRIPVRDGFECNVYSWNVHSNKNNGIEKLPTALIIVYHGFCAHGCYPTVRYACEMFAKTNDDYAIMAPDFPGHGKSDGLRGYLPSSTTLIEDGVTFAKHARSIYNSNNNDDKNNNAKTPKMFLIGSSMGGTIALSVAEKLRREEQINVSGVVLLAPMLKLNVGTPARMLLSTLSMVLPTAQIIPSSASSSEKQYRDAAKRKECDDDTLSIDTGGYIHVASASTCVELTNSIQQQFTTVTTPLLIMVADEDVIVNSEGSIHLMEQAKSEDKTLKRYPALHGLLCEPSPLIDEIQNDLREWIKARV